MQIYLAKPGGALEGPFTLDKINEDLSARRYKDSDYWAWHKGLTDWVPLYSIGGVCAATDTTIFFAKPPSRETPPPAKPPEIPGADTAFFLAFYAPTEDKPSVEVVGTNTTVIAPIPVTRSEPPAPAPVQWVAVELSPNATEPTVPEPAPAPSPTPANPGLASNESAPAANSPLPEPAIEKPPAPPEPPASARKRVSTQPKSQPLLPPKAFLRRAGQGAAKSAKPQRAKKRPGAPEIKTVSVS